MTDEFHGLEPGFHGVDEPCDSAEESIAINQYWAHKSSGEVYAVQIKLGHNISACGPLHHTEVTQANLDTWNFNNEPEDAVWIDESMDDFNVLEAPYPGDNA